MPHEGVNRLCTLPLLVWGEVRPQFFFCGIFLEYSSYYLKCSVSLGCPFPHPLARESRLSLGLIFSVLIAVFGLSYYSTPRLVYMRQKDNSGTHLHLFSRALRSLASLLPFLHLSESSYFYYMYNVQILVVRSGRNQEKYLYHIFLKVKIPRGYIFYDSFGISNCFKCISTKHFLGNTTFSR